MSAPLSCSRKIRLERLKRFSNAQLDYLKRLYDGTPIDKKYLAGEIDLHVHFAMRGMWCATYRARKAAKARVATSKSVCSETSPNVSELPVFIHVRKVAKNLSPIASIIRLERLEVCNMRGIEALAPDILCPRPELIFRVYDRKLRELLSLSGIVFKDFKDEVIESATKVVTNLANQDSDTHGREREILSCGLECVRRVRIEITENGILLFAKRREKPMPQISKVFVCPDYSFEAGIERVRGHAIIPK